VKRKEKKSILWDGNSTKNAKPNKKEILTEESYGKQENRKIEGSWKRRTGGQWGLWRIGSSLF